MNLLTYKLTTLERLMRDVVGFFKSVTILLLFFTILAFRAPSPALALEDGSLDPGFVNGVYFGANTTVYSIATQSDGKILIGGDFTTYNGVARGSVARLNSDGSLDITFLATGAGANTTVRSIAIQSDGKIVIGGDFTTYNGVARNNIARLNSDGSLDTTFLATGAGVNGFVPSVSTIAIQSDGMILIGGAFSTYNGVARNNIARLNSDGSLDTTFLATGAGANSTVYSLAIQSDGKILIGGSFTTYNGVARGSVARLNSDGSLDITFLATGAGANTTVYSLVIQSDGMILIGGAFATYNGVARGSVARLNSEGSLDNTFLATGAGANTTVRSLAIQSDGKILIGGAFTTYNGVARDRLALLNSDGSLDTTFLATGAGASSTVYSLAIQSDGMILIGGAFTTYNGVVNGKIARLNTDGSLDTTFLARAGASSTVRSIAVQSDGMILIGGDFTTYNGVTRGSVARLNTDGSLDTTFLATGAGANGFVPSVSTIVIQSDGKILIGGDFTTYNGVARNNIARLNSDGSLDTTFLATEVGANSTVRSLAIQSDGKILIGGAFATYNGVARVRIARLNSDGSLDTTFLTTGAGASSTVRSLAIQSDGKILIGGSFTTYNGVARVRIARLNTDGSLDTSFLATEAGANGTVYSLAIQSDGKMLIGGSFTTYNGVARGSVTRFNSDGSLDTTFLATEAGANGTVNSLSVQSDGKMLIGGSFTTYNGVARGYVARLNSDGTLDTTFLATGAGASSAVYSLAIQSDGMILIGGAFRTFNNSSAAFITRLTMDTTAPAGGSISYTGGYYTITSVALAVADGTDSESGLNTSTRITQRKSATLSAGTCGSFGSFATIAPTGTYPNLVDATIASGNCYQYQYQISDNSGNQTIYASSSIIQVDTDVPSTGSISSSSSNSVSNYPGPSTCANSKPTAVTDLFQINVNKTSAQLYFTPVSDADNYFISFATTANAEEHGTNVYLAREGIQNFKVNLLKPNTTYYFKVRANNGCMPGDWSQILKVKTLRSETPKPAIYYKSNSVVKKITNQLFPKVKKSSVKSPAKTEITTPLATPTPIVRNQPAAIDQVSTKKCVLWGLWCW